MYKQWFFHPEREPLFAEIVTDDDVHRLLDDGYTTRPLVPKNFSRARQMIYHAAEEPKEIFLDELSLWLAAGWAASPEAFKAKHEMEDLQKRIAYHEAEAALLKGKLHKTSFPYGLGGTDGGGKEAKKKGKRV